MAHRQVARTLKLMHKSPSPLLCNTEQCERNAHNFAISNDIVNKICFLETYEMSDIVSFQKTTSGETIVNTTERRHTYVKLRCLVLLLIKSRCIVFMRFINLC